MANDSKTLTGKEFLTVFKAYPPAVQKRLFSQIKKPFSNGTQRGRQKYKCSACAKNFSDHPHTSLRGTHYPELWPKFMEDMIKNESIRESTKRLGLAGSTVFNWRHKVLNALRRMEPKEFEGLLEIDETYFRYSEKGNKNIVGRKPHKRGEPSQYRGISREQACVVVSRDRNTVTHAKIACMEPITKVVADTLLTPLVNSVSAICSDANGTWRVFAQSAKKEHVVLNASLNERVKISSASRTLMLSTVASKAGRPGSRTLRASSWTTISPGIFFLILTRGRPCRRRRLNCCWRSACRFLQSAIWI